MTILSRPTITKGTPAIITLSKSDLHGISLISNHARFGDVSNMKFAVFIYENSFKQKKRIDFDMESGATINALFKTSVKLRSDFQLKDIIVIDQDGESFQMTREMLTAAGMNVAEEFDMGSASYSRDFSSPSTLLSYEQAINTFGVGEGFLQIGGSGAQYINNAPEISLIEGSGYELRLYPIYVAQGLNASVGGEVFGFDYSALSNAIGSYVSVSFTATAGQAASLTKIQISPSSFGFYVRLAKIEIIKVS
jgi:hypothetical protein